MKPKLTIKLLQEEAAKFAEVITSRDEPSLYGVTDGKAVGTWFEHRLAGYLAESYEYKQGSPASGVDFPDLGVDMKVTSIQQPQSSCPFKDASQKIYGLGYHLLVFVYEKVDNGRDKTCRFNIPHTLFIEDARTADFQTTKGILDILARGGNKDDVMAFIQERSLPVDEIGADQLADRVMKNPPDQGYLTISNALQWRLLYSRVIQNAGEISGVFRVR